MGLRNNSTNTNSKFLMENPEYLLHYNDFLKTAKVFQDSGQYWLSKEYYNKASCLRRGDVNNGMQYVKTESFIYNKNTGTIGGKYFIE
jgi:hypothetical protein